MRISTAALVGRIAPARYRDKAMPFAERIDHMISAADDRALAQRTALIAFVIRVASAALAYLSQILMARLLGSYEYGIYVVVWVWLLILGNVTSLGFGTSVLRYIPEYGESDRPDLLRGLLVGSRFYGMVVATVVATLGVAGAWTFGDFIGDHYLMPIYLAAVCLPLMTLTEVQDGIARAYDWIDLALAPPYLVRPLMILGFLFGAVLIGAETTATTAMIASIIAVWMTAIGQLLMLKRRIGDKLPAGPRTMTTMPWIRASLPMFLIEGFFVLLTNTDVVVAGWYLPPEEIAIYFAVIKTLALVHFVYFAVRAAAAHKFSQYHAAGDREQLTSFIRDSVRWTFWPSFAVSIAMLLVGRWFLMLFGEGFVDGYPLVFILVVGVLARASIGPAEALLTMAGQQHLCATIYGMTFLLNLALNLLLIPMVGLAGAAIATTCAILFETAMLFVAARDRLHLHVFIWLPKRTATAAPAEVQ
ncbi:MAG: lipopolysaccharide biosynthesis protein [Hyphomicrobiales bacterium]|nr:lipopolysaccharide biosynthesis protein [Hyphomicrobiales bacterium]